MQPYFFPYIGYFDLINYTDRWFVFDTAQYIRRGWVNRNRILHPHEGWQYVSVPVAKHARSTRIRDITVSDPGAMRSRLLRQLEHYRHRAPYFGTVRDLVATSLAADEGSLSRMNIATLRAVCDYLGIAFEFDLVSEAELPFESPARPGDWGLELTRMAGGTEYVNPAGGRELYDPERFNEAGLALTIRDMPTFRYQTPGYEFEPGLSIIDVMMWNPPEAIRGFLDDGANYATQLET